MHCLLVHQEAQALSADIILLLYCISLAVKYWNWNPTRKCVLAFGFIISESLRQTFFGWSEEAVTWILRKSSALLWHTLLSHQDHHQSLYRLARLSRLSPVDNSEILFISHTTIKNTHKSHCRFKHRLETLVEVCSRSYSEYEHEWRTSMVPAWFSTNHQQSVPLQNPQTNRKLEGNYHYLERQSIFSIRCPVSSPPEEEAVVQ